VRATIDSMRMELEPILTDEQRETLTRRIRMHRHRSGFRPPGRNVE
jgi:hypothetical protein